MSTTRRRGYSQGGRNRTLGPWTRLCPKSTGSPGGVDGGCFATRGCEFSSRGPLRQVVGSAWDHESWHAAPRAGGWSWGPRLGGDVAKLGAAAERHPLAAGKGVVILQAASCSRPISGG